MDNILFFYNIALTVFFTISLTGFCIIYMKNKSRAFLYLGLFFALLIIDNSIVYISEFSQSFESLYETDDTIYIVIYLLYFAMVMNARLIIQELLDDPFTTREKYLSIVIPAILTILIITAPYEVSEGLFYVAFFTALSYIAYRGYVNLNNLDIPHNRIYKLLLISMIALCILSGIESNAIKNVRYQTFENFEVQGVLKASSAAYLR